MIQVLAWRRLGLRHRRIVKAVLSSGASRTLASLVSLVSLPLCVRYLGAERFGVWATITTTAVWINLIDLGIGNTLTNQISTAFALDDHGAARRYFTNALLLTGFASALAGAAFSLIFRSINWINLFSVSSGVSPSEVTQTIAIAVALTLFGLPCSLVGKVLAGYQQLHRFAYASAAGALASLAGLFAGISLHVRMPLLYLLSAGCIGFTQAILLLATISEKRWLLPRLSALSTSALKELLRSGLWFLMIQVAAIVVFSSDNLIVSHYLGPAEVTPYNVTWRLAGLAALLQSLTFPAVWPAYAESHAAEDYRWIRHTFLTMIRGVAAVNLVCAAILVPFGRTLIRLWAGNAAVPRRSLLWAMALWAVISGLMSVESCLLAALNRIRVQAILSIVAAGVNVWLSIVLVRRMGAVGVICGTIVSYLVVLVVPQTLIVRKVWRRELQDRRRPLREDSRFPTHALTGSESTLLIESDSRLTWR